MMSLVSLCNGVHNEPVFVMGDSGDQSRPAAKSPSHTRHSTREHWMVASWVRPAGSLTFTEQLDAALLSGPPRYVVGANITVSISGRLRQR